MLYTYIYCSATHPGNRRVHKSACLQQSFTTLTIWMHTMPCAFTVGREIGGVKGRRCGTSYQGPYGNCAPVSDEARRRGITGCTAILYGDKQKCSTPLRPNRPATAVGDPLAVIHDHQLLSATGDHRFASAGVAGTTLGSRGAECIRGGSHKGNHFSFEDEEMRKHTTQWKAGKRNRLMRPGVHSDPCTLGNRTGWGIGAFMGFQHMRNYCSLSSWTAALLILHCSRNPLDPLTVMALVKPP